jgi:hypothetical protein
MYGKLRPLCKGMLGTHYIANLVKEEWTEFSFADSASDK